jgi:hypothetical protein
MFNLDSRTKSKLAWMATLLAPVIAVQGVRGVFGISAAPAPAGAATVGPLPPAPASAAPAVEKALTPTQAKARTWLLSRTHTLQSRSPMDRPDPTNVEATTSAAVKSDNKISAPVIIDVPKVTLTAMISSNSDGQPLTVINEKMYRIGDAISPHWRVAGIDTRRRVVTLVGPENRTVELQPPTPSTQR